MYKIFTAKNYKNGIEEDMKLDYKTIYLTTDHEGYYEKYGWTRIMESIF